MKVVVFLLVLFNVTFSQVGTLRETLKDCTGDVKDELFVGNTRIKSMYSLGYEISGLRGWNFGYDLQKNIYSDGGAILEYHDKRNNSNEMRIPRLIKQHRFDRRVTLEEVPDGEWEDENIYGFSAMVIMEKINEFIRYHVPGLQGVGTDGDMMNIVRIENHQGGHKDGIQETNAIVFVKRYPITVELGGDRAIRYDVLGHEMGHAIIYNVNRNFYFPTEGIVSIRAALNEFYADFFGFIIEYENLEPNSSFDNHDVSTYEVGKADWIQGEGMRCFKTPWQFNHPSYYEGVHWECRNNSHNLFNFTASHTHQTFLIQAKI